jgi:muramoyltetrapeptide carboxypeptidase
MGFQVSVPSHLYRQRGYLAGTDRERADELMAAFLDPRVKAIFPGTGGYGTTRIVDRLDYEAIRRHPKILLGFSDITGLHLAIHKKTGLVTFHGPNLMWGLGSEEGQDPFAAQYQWRALLEKEYRTDEGEYADRGYVYEIPADATPIEVMTPGIARGRLTGGNLSLISPLIGTEYEIETDGRILFIEDVHEEPYGSIAICLIYAWRENSIASRESSLDIQPLRTEDPERSLSLEEVFRDYFAISAYRSS